MLNEILDTIKELRSIENSKSLELSVHRSLQWIKSYIGYEVPKELMGLVVEMALLIFDQKGYVEQIEGVKSIKEGEVSVSFSENTFNSCMAEIQQELNLYRCTSW